MRPDNNVNDFPYRGYGSNPINTFEAPTSTTHTAVQNAVILGKYYNKEIKYGAALLGGLIVVLWLVWHVFFWLFGTHAVASTVTSKEWSRITYIDWYKWTNEHQQGGAPAGARDITQNWEVVGYIQVYAGQNCSTSKYGRSCTPYYRSQAVYGWVYYYQIREWTPERVIGYDITYGNGQKAVAPIWKPYTLVSADQSEQYERVNHQSQTYTIHFTGNDKHTYTQTFPESNWNNIQIGTGFTLQVDRLGQVRHSKMN